MEDVYEPAGPGMLVASVFGKQKNFHAQVVVAPGEERVIEIVVTKP